MATDDRRVAEHAAAFNAAAAMADWGSFAERFAVDAVMSFDGVPVGPFEGRAAIAAAYAADPPREGIELVGPVVEDGEELVTAFRWLESGGTGWMRFRFDEDGGVRRLVVAFDRPPRH